MNNYPSLRPGCEEGCTQGARRMINCSNSACKEAALFEVAQMDRASLVIAPRKPFCAACMGAFIQKKAGRSNSDYVFVVKKVKEY